MRLTRDERAVLNEIIDEALAFHDGEHVNVVHYVEIELMALEAQGHTWVVDLLDACRWTGLSNRVRQRARAGRVAVGSESVPTCYVTGGTMTSWLHVPVDELDPVVERLHDQAETLNAHASIIERGQDAARRNGVVTAYEGFTAEGVVITSVAS